MMASQRDIAIITDSTSDLTAALCEEHGITVVPLSVTIGDETLEDGTLTTEEFFERMNALPELPTTSQPPVGAFVDAYERALETASSVVSIHLSEKLSGTYSSAKTAAEHFAGRVRVIDSQTLSWGLGLQVLEAAKAVSRGMDIESVVDGVKGLRDRVQVIVGLDTMDNIVKGGRLSKTAGKVGGMLNVKITVEVKDGEIVLSRVTRGSKAALAYGLKWIDSHMGDSKRGIFCVMHALSPERAEWLRDALQERYDVEEMHFVETGTVIATHTGTGWGVALLPLD
jgi:DegV family protein with EDD domain